MFNKFIVCFFFLNLLFNGSLCQSDVCSQPLVEPGKCRASIKRWGYDPEIGECREFTWGGCDDNGNNFESYSQCKYTCET
ncbi:PI-stichotoxin-Hcr2f-like [Cydia pomonella]|uniref:PI-stichotoxin-Hcr2f-like n=1 Tax=Cydia pomonella TaxID=82600 RepID=UPI002ADE5845|nr:PI-stichotoxin-Hcr2f-like [Cydia pomonella]